MDNPSPTPSPHTVSHLENSDSSADSSDVTENSNPDTLKMPALFDIEAFKKLYDYFDAATLNGLPDLYTSDIVFKDPIHQLQGIDQLHRYFTGFCTAQMTCRFEFHNQIISTDQAFLQWQMHYRHPRLHGGKLLLLNGSTLIKFHSHIYYHEDFYDMGAMLYQHIPILGWVVKKINAGLLSSS